MSLRARIPQAKLDLDGKRVVLLLQGGGALGAYHVGVFSALHDRCRNSGRKIDWVAGVSIGAINATVIAGNEPEHALNKLETIWRGFRWPSYDVALKPFIPLYEKSWLASLVGKYFDWWMVAFPFGQTSFFRSRVMNPFENPWTLQWLGPRATSNISFYDTRPLRDTLNNCVDWKRINDDSATRLSLGATNLETGELMFFNSFEPQTESLAPRVTLTADHVLASGALPPAFPAIAIRDDTGCEQLYWDGGLVSNTPLMDLQDELRAGDKGTVVFDVHIFERKGPKPRSLDEVIWRQKSIQFGSRKRQAAEIVSKHEAEAKAGGPKTTFEVCQVMYECDPDSPQFWCSDGDFSATAFDALHQQGRRDMHAAFDNVPVIVEGDYGALYRIGSLRRGESDEPKVSYPSKSRLN